MNWNAYCLNKSNKEYSTLPARSLHRMEVPSVLCTLYVIRGAEITTQETQEKVRFDSMSVYRYSWNHLRRCPVGRHTSNFQKCLCTLPERHSLRSSLHTRCNLR